MIDDHEIRKLMCSVLKGDEPQAWADDFDFRASAVDSLDMVNFTLKLEEATDLRIPDSEFDGMRSFAGVKQVLARLEAENKAGGNIG